MPVAATSCDSRCKMFGSRAEAPSECQLVAYSSCDAYQEAASDSPCSSSSVIAFSEAAVESADAADAALQHLLWLEAKSPSPSGYLSEARGLTASVRASVIDWLCNTSYAMRLPREVLHQAVALLDRYLAQRTCSTSSSAASSGAKLPLGATACACLAIAAKLEAATAPPLRAYLSYLSQDVTLEALRQAEGAVLAALDYRVAQIATTSNALAAILQQLHEQGAAPLDAQTLYLASYLADLSLLEYHLLQVAPSRLAAACLAYAALLRGGCLNSGEVVGRVVGCSQQQLAEPLAWLSAVHMTVSAAAAHGCPYAVTRWYPANNWC